MKCFCSFLLTIFLSASLNAEEFTIYIDENYPPFSYTQNGEPKGLYVEILNKVFSKLDGNTITMEGITWNRGKRLMKTGEGLALMPPYFHGHDWPYLYPYSLSFYTETVVSYCKSHLLNEPKSWPHDFSGLLVGSITGYDGWGGTAFRKLVKEKKIHYKEVSNPTQLVKLLLLGRIDCIMMEKSAFAIAKKHIEATSDTSKHIKIATGPTVGEDPVYIGYSEPAIKSGKFGDTGELRKQIDSIIYQLLKSGEIKQIIHRHIKDVE